MEGTRHFNHAVGQNCFHLVWKVKYSYEVLNRPTLRKAVEGMIKFIARQQDWQIYELKVMPDHVHVFIGFPYDVSAKYVLTLLKVKTAGMLLRNFAWLKKYFRKGHFWSPGKFFRSVGNVTYDVVQNYIKYSQGSWKTNFTNLPSYYQQRKLSAFSASH